MSIYEFDEKIQTSIVVGCDVIEKASDWFLHYLYLGMCTDMFFRGLEKDNSGVYRSSIVFVYYMADILYTA